MTAAAQTRRSDARLPTSLRFSHINLPTRNFSQSQRFYIEVLGGRPVRESADVRIRFADFDVVLGAQQGGATAPHLEYPHYAFTVPPEQFLAWKRRLEGFGIPTHDPWTRAGETHAIMYFRDPSGNQFELFCPSGDTGIELRLGHRAGGDYVVPFTSLVYEQVSDAKTDTPALPRTPLAFNHMTIPARNFGESRRFFTEIFGSKVLFDIPNIHVQVVVGGVEVGYGGPADASWPWPPRNAPLPRYTLRIAAEELLPLKERLGKFGIPTSEIWTLTGRDAALYFRDPSSNLWELYCEAGFSGAAQRGPRAGGSYAPDLEALIYDTWKDPQANQVSKLGSP